MKNYRFSILLLGGVILGSILGLVLGEKVTVVKPIGDVFLNLIFTIVVPLVLFSVASAIANMNGMKRLGKIMGSMMLVFIVTGMIASILMLVAVKMFPPAEGVSITLGNYEPMEEVSLAEQIVSTFTVGNVSDLLNKSNMLAIIVFSVLLGLATNLSGERGEPFKRFLQSASDVLSKMMSLIMYAAPIGLGAYFAYLIGTYGEALVGSYVKALIIYFVVGTIYFTIGFSFYAFIAGGKNGVISLWKNMLAPATTALATCSSIASIPTNLLATEKMGVTNDIRETVIPLGASLHKEGSCLGCILKISFLFSLFGKDFTGIGTFVTAILIAVLAGTAMSGIPSGGMIAETLIITLYGFPMEALPILAVIATLIDAPATMINATGDNVSSMLVQRMVDGKNKKYNIA